MTPKGVVGAHDHRSERAADPGQERHRHVDDDRVREVVRLGEVDRPAPARVMTAVAGGDPGDQPPEGQVVVDRERGRGVGQSPVFENVSGLGLVLVLLLSDVLVKVNEPPMSRSC